MNNSLCTEKTSKRLVSELTTTISPDSFDSQIELIFNKNAKINKYTIELRFVLNRKQTTKP